MYTIPSRSLTAATIYAVFHAAMRSLAAVMTGVLHRADRSVRKRRGADGGVERTLTEQQSGHDGVSDERVKASRGEG
jgi:hypothetical protein